MTTSLFEDKNEPVTADRSTGSAAPASREIAPRSPKNVNITFEDPVAEEKNRKKGGSSFMPKMLANAFGRGKQEAVPAAAAKSAEAGGGDFLTNFSSEDALDEDDVEDMDDMAALGFHTLLTIFGGLSMLSTPPEAEADAAAKPKQDFGGDANRLRKKLRDRERGLINPRSAKMQCERASGLKPAGRAADAPFPAAVRMLPCCSLPSLLPALAAPCPRCSDSISVRAQRACV